MEEKIIETLLGKKVNLEKADKKKLQDKVKTLLCALTIAQDSNKGYDSKREE